MTASSASTALGSEAANAARAEEVVIKCAGVTKLFKDFWMRSKVRAVDDVNIEVRRGEVFGLLGPNGSGKSTTIKMILGLLHPTAGRIAVFGKRPDDVATKKRIGYLPEESYLYPFLNARETLEYYSRLFHQNVDQRRRRIDMLLKMVGLDAVQRRPVREYSKGMQRRIGIAQALINDPDLLVLDEPTTGMDPIGTAQIKDLVKALARKGKTILLCSHLLADVEDVCDRVSIMYGGKVRAEGTVDELLTEQQMTTIQVPDLDDETIRRVDELLAKRGKAIAKVEQPRQRLEKFFLDIVHKAQSEGAKTSGATAGGPIADFLVDEARSAHLPEGAEAAALINKLTGLDDTGEAAGATPTTADHGKAKPAPASTMAAPPTPSAAPLGTHVDEGADVSVIAALSGASVDEQAASDEPMQPPADTTQDGDVSQPTGDVSVIDGLLGGAADEDDAPAHHDQAAADEQAWRDLDMPVLDEKTVRRDDPPPTTHSPIRPEDLIAQLANDASDASDGDEPDKATDVAQPSSEAEAKVDDVTMTATDDSAPAKPAAPSSPSTDQATITTSPPPAVARPAFDPNDPSPSARLQRANAELLARLAKAGRKADAQAKTAKPVDEPQDNESPDSAFKDVLKELQPGEAPQDGSDA